MSEIIESKGRKETEIKTENALNAAELDILHTFVEKILETDLIGNRELRFNMCVVGAEIEEIIIAKGNAEIRVNIIGEKTEITMRGIIDETKIIEVVTIT